MPSPTLAVERLIRALEAVTRLAGAIAIGLTLLLILATCAVVVMRYFLATGSIALQESMSYMHGAIFMLGAAWTLRVGGHVRVDVFYRGAAPRAQAWSDVAGGRLCLLPLRALILWRSWGYVLSRWGSAAKSTERQRPPHGVA